jgi:hypothetical protein
VKTTPLALFAVLAVVSARGTSAFTFSDGTSAACEGATEIDAAPDVRVIQLNHTAITERGPSGYQIQWNARKLASLPPAIHDLLFFHECAHAQVPTKDEVRANCEGLIAMRAAGRAGFAVESKLAAFYGAGSEYWAKTLKCANEASEPPPTRD